MLLQGHPPRRHISSAPVSLSAASALLDKYLEDSQTHAHLHPDALITPDGVTFNSQGGAMGNPLMHHLRRVAAGMRGEYRAPDKTLEAQEREQEQQQQRGAKSGVADEEWQDMAAYQAEQGVTEVGDVGERSNLVQEGGEEPEVQTKDARKRTKEQADDGQATASGGIDKEARKKAKKERDMQRKREKTTQANKAD
ncbi:hypothetical protein ACJQWK_09883 [Exserohilum turcicum]|uniref:Uncharacterized protein n=1 Tax=Exserohilum turcicum (strain 28A) TaxID=671987 RepID=R0I536_EXST2|nr:uncharacterized protein SETTUDRAFT_24192 [Exserohilum turcica Et28A]EOA80676.1 hypothetical protein SETTUDRAFT_24192 [Exserohilum turcica Et28A]